MLSNADFANVVVWPQASDAQIELELVDDQGLVANAVWPISEPVDGKRLVALVPEGWDVLLTHAIAVPKTRAPQATTKMDFGTKVVRERAEVSVEERLLAEMRTMKSQLVELQDAAVKDARREDVLDEEPSPKPKPKAEESPGEPVAPDGGSGDE